MRIAFFFTLTFLLFSLSCGPRLSSQRPMASQGQMTHPKNIILMIGDGMGLSQISAAMYANDNRISLEKFPVSGLQKPGSAEGPIAGPAASATAFASGVRTYSGAIGLTKDSLPAFTILEEAEARGLATGIVTTSSVTHATSAAFFAHTDAHGLHEQIAAFFLETEIDCFIGGGMQYFAARKSDERNLYRELQKKGYIVSDFSKEPFGEFFPTYNRNFAFFTAEKEPAGAAQGRDYLPKATRLSANYLDRRIKEKGFFLLVEAAQLGWGGHQNDLDMILTELTDFDQAIEEALRFAQEDGETLLIVTANHEAGGFAINPGSRRDSIIPGFTTTQHTASLLPVFAYGPGAELFSGIYDNTAIYHKMRRAYGFDSPSVR